MNDVVQDVAQAKAAPIVDAGSLILVGGTLAELLPPVTAVVSLIWVCMRVYVTVLEIIDKHKKKKDESA